MPHYFTNNVQCFCIGTYNSIKIEFGISVGPNVSDSNIFEAWLVQVLTMKFLNHFRSIDKIDIRFLGPFAYFVILPINKIL